MWSGTWRRCWLGGFIYPFSEYATPAEKLSQRPGYQTDPTAAIKEARQLLAAAGYPDGIKDVDFVIRDAASFKLWSVAIQAMLKDALNIESNLRMVQVSVWFDEAQAGNYDLTLSAIVSTLMDPSDYFNAWYTKDGPQNYSRWNNPAFDGLVQQIDRELDDGKRKALIRQAEAIMEKDPPCYRSPGNGFMMAGSTMSRVTTRMSISASMMSIALTPCG